MGTPKNQGHHRRIQNNRIPHIRAPRWDPQYFESTLDFEPQSLGPFTEHHCTILYPMFSTGLIISFSSGPIVAPSLHVLVSQVNSTNIHATRDDPSAPPLRMRSANLSNFLFCVASPVGYAPGVQSYLPRLPKALNQGTCFTPSQQLL